MEMLPNIKICAASLEELGSNQSLNHFGQIQPKTGSSCKSNNLQPLALHTCMIHKDELNCMAAGIRSKTEPRGDIQWQKNGNLVDTCQKLAAGAARLPKKICCTMTVHTGRLIQARALMCFNEKTLQLRSCSLLKIVALQASFLASPVSSQMRRHLI